MRPVSSKFVDIKVCLSLKYLLVEVCRIYIWVGVSDQGSTTWESFISWLWDFNSSSPLIDFNEWIKVMNVIEKLAVLRL